MNISSILEIPDLSRGAKLALLALLSFRNGTTGQCNPKLPKLCERMNAPPTTVRRWLCELRSKQIITATRKKYQGGNYYNFPALALVSFIPSTDGRNGSIPSTGGRSIPSTGGRSGDPYPLYELNNRNYKRAAARIPPKKSTSSTPPLSATEQTLACYYKNQQRKAGA